jgi:hypothetical protein
MNHQVKETLHAMAYPIYVARGRRPWLPGYNTARRRQIETAMDNGLLKPGVALPKGYGYRLDERVIEIPWVLSRMPDDPGKMLDAGSALNYDFLVKLAPLSNAKLTICTLAPEPRCYWGRGISYVFDDLRSSMFRSETFDTIASISTIEHIGLDNTMLYTGDKTKQESDCEGFRAAVREFRRIIRPGGSCFITFPYGKACNHGWFQVFDAQMVQMVLGDFEPAHQQLDYFGYSAEGWHTAEPSTLKEATCFNVHEEKEFGADFAACARGVLCMRLTA